MARDPVSATIDGGTATLEALATSTRRASLWPERSGEMAAVDVGQTPSSVVYEENKLELLHYEARTDEQHDRPILIVYALINRPYILDLQPNRSVVRRLLDAGHDVYLIDWNEPSRLDQHLGLDDYVTRYMDNCVDVVRDRSGQDAINILGYCMGGTKSAMYAALFPEKVNALGLMAAGLYFDDTGGVLEAWGDETYFEASDVTDTYGNAPAELLDDGFALMDPVANYVTKYVGLAENLEDEDFVANFARMEEWLSDGIDVAGRAYVEFLEWIYQDNLLCQNQLSLDGKHVDLDEIDMPILQILGEYDHLIPPETSRPFNDVVASDDTSIIEYPTGHIGLSVSASSHEHVWPEVAEWFAAAQPTAEAGASAGAPDESVERIQEAGAAAAVTDDGTADVETLEDVGPTFAARLRTEGIETVADLAGYEAAELADIAETNETRAAGWLAQL